MLLLLLLMGASCPVADALQVNQGKKIHIHFEGRSRDGGPRSLAMASEVLRSLFAVSLPLVAYAAACGVRRTVVTALEH